MILRILPTTRKVKFDAFDAAGARDTAQVGAKALFRRPVEPMLHFHLVRFVQIRPLGHKYAAC